MVRELKTDEQIKDLIGIDGYAGLFKQAVEQAKKQLEAFPEMKFGCVCGYWGLCGYDVWAEFDWKLVDLVFTKGFNMGVHKFMYCEYSGNIPDEFLDRINFYKGTKNFRLNDKPTKL